MVSLRIINFELLAFLLCNAILSSSCFTLPSTKVTKKASSITSSTKKLQHLQPVSRRMNNRSAIPTNHHDLKSVDATTTVAASTAQETTIQESTYNVGDGEDFSKSRNVEVCFSHIHLYVDALQDVETYKKLEESLNAFAERASSPTNRISRASDEGGSALSVDIEEGRQLWKAIHTVAEDEGQTSEGEGGVFVTQNRDVVKQLLAGLGFRITGMSYPGGDNGVYTRNLLVTTSDPNGVQIVVSALDGDITDDVEEKKVKQNSYHHFDSSNIRQFYQNHADRQGIAVLAFQVTSGTIEALYQQYKLLHPTLITDECVDGPIVYNNSSNENGGHGETKVLEVYAYYQGDDSNGDADQGTKLRFVHTTLSDGDAPPTCILPGLKQVEAKFDNTCMPAYCDHWVSNVVSRTGFIKTLEDVLGFNPKVDFNAGVVAAGEAQIESTVTGNNSSFSSDSKESALRDQSQVYLPINNALSEVGHVHGFLEEIGQGIQHIASRVNDLTAFVQRGNDYRKMTGEGFTFLNIPRSYYGVLTTKELMNGIDRNKNDASLSFECASAIMNACENCKIATSDGAVDLDLSIDDISSRLDKSISASSFYDEYLTHKGKIIKVIMRSRYNNLYGLLGKHISEEKYLAIVRNKILVDVQGDDLLFQIFTCNILQRKAGEEAPFFEFIQRVCSECIGPDGCPVKVKPGCGGFGIRNFLTLFLSIEVSKAMLQVTKAKSEGDWEGQQFAQSMVDVFTDQLNESNPILTEISDAMTEEGSALNEMRYAMAKGDEHEVALSKKRADIAGAAKVRGNEKLMICSAKYKELMKSMRLKST